jgi:hypothetical protein
VIAVSPSRLDARGVTANRHETWGGMRWTRGCRVRMRSQGEAIRERSSSLRDERQCCGRPRRVVLTTQCWCQVSMVSREPNRAAMCDHPGNDGGTAGPRGEHAISC